MTRLRAMIVSLTTDPGADSNTHDQLYVGLWGTGGGREFTLASSKSEPDGFGGDNFAAGTMRVFLLGDLPSVTRPTEGRQSDRSENGETNDPNRLEIALDEVQYVYLRKQAYGAKVDEDDAYRLTRISVDLFGTETTGSGTATSTTTAKTPEKRFELEARALWLGNEFGHQVWLKEEEVPVPPK
jgi:hypothetical protein